MIFANKRPREQTIEIPVDNTATDHTLKQANPILSGRRVIHVQHSEKLEAFLEKIDSIKKEDLVTGIACLFLAL